MITVLDNVINIKQKQVMVSGAKCTCKAVGFVARWAPLLVESAYWMSNPHNLVAERAAEP